MYVPIHLFRALRNNSTKRAFLFCLQDFADLLEKSKKLEQSIHRLQHQQLQDAEVLPAAEAKNSKLESEVKRLGRVSYIRFDTVFCFVRVS